MQEPLALDILSRAVKLRYGSLHYAEPYDLKDCVVFSDLPGLILLTIDSYGRTRILWAADDMDRLICLIARISGAPLAIDCIPDKYGKGIERLGYRKIKDYKDYFNENLAYNGKPCIINLLTPERYHEASDLSRNCSVSSGSFEGESVEWFSDWINTGTGEVIVLYDAANRLSALSCVSIYQSRGVPTLWIRMLAVARELQGKGLGKRIMTHTVFRGIEKGANRAYLACEDTVLAKRLYEKFGFVKGVEQGNEYIKY